MFSYKDKDKDKLAQSADVMGHYRPHEISRSVLGAWHRIRQTQTNQWNDGEGFEDVGIWGNSQDWGNGD